MGGISRSGGISADSSNAGRVKNVIINGNFKIWQRAASQTATGYGSADRFAFEISGSTQSVSRQAFTVGQTDVPGNPRFYARCIATSVAGANNYVFMKQNIEDVRQLSGGNVTLSFYAKADSSKNIAVELVQKFGTGGSAQVNGIGSQLVALTSSWQKFEITIAVPSISGKTVASNDHSLQVNFWMDAGSSYDARTVSLGQQSGTFDIANVQLEEGSTAGIFEDRTFVEELVLCKRYFQRDGMGTMGQWRTTTSADMYTTFDIEMRTTPTGSVNTTTARLTTPGLANYDATGGTFIAGSSSTVGAFYTLLGFTGAVVGNLAVIGNSTTFVHWDAEL